jgi:hypothetical protein
MKTNQFNYRHLIKKYMQKIVSFCAFFDIIDKKCGVSITNIENFLRLNAKHGFKKPI